MARRGSLPRGFVRPPARTMVWFGTNHQPTLLAANTVGLLTTLNAVALALRPFTIVRSHFQVNWFSDQSAASEIPNGAIGRMIANDQAVAAGVVSLPDPMTEFDAPWYMWQAMSTRFVFASGVGFETSGNQYQIDSKAMRKVGLNEDVVMVATNAHAAHGANIGVIGRYLVKLS